MFHGTIFTKIHTDRAGNCCNGGIGRPRYFFLSKSHLGDSFKAGFEEGYKSTRGN